MVSCFDLPREEPSFSYPEEESNSQKTLEIDYSSRANGYEPPTDHDTADPDGGRKVFHGEVAGSLAEDIRDEEHCYNDVVTVTSKIELVDHVIFRNIIVESARIAQVDLDSSQHLHRRIFELGIVKDTPYQDN
jgi:hypothetical protein